MQQQRHAGKCIRAFNMFNAKKSPICTVVIFRGVQLWAARIEKIETLTLMRNNGKKRVDV
jgi:hypothetical protein